MLGGELPEDEAGLDQIAFRSGGTRQSFDAGSEKVEEMRSQSGDQAAFRIEQAVDGPSGCADVACNAPDRQGLRAVLLNGPFSRSEERGRGSRVVLAWPSHT